LYPDYSRWIPDYDCAIGHIVNDYGASADYRPRSDLSARNNRGRSAYERSFTYLHRAAQDYPGRQVHEVANDAIVINLRSRVDDHMITYARLSLDDGPVKDHGAGPIQSKPRDRGGRMDGVCKSMNRYSSYFFSHQIVADGHHGPCIRRKQRVVGAPLRHAKKCTCILWIK
jgi:hypothetical protein